MIINLGKSLKPISQIWSKMDENECTQSFSLGSPQGVLVSEEATRKSDTKLEFSAQLKNDKNP